ncbi:asparagine synthase (glutamine-hydrolyzing) [Pseudomonas sp. NUPR-001]|uniref:asparagine synthase (glutamine-hydrolyzing) n=1 Tax=Pseudomonas sp. NUPR-001 TaxID=3416058 RepID=UPI003F9759E3
MCGFSGYFQSSPISYDPAEVLRRMGDAIYRRGPDDGGEWFDINQGIGLSHRRLAIVDLSSAGAQPMLSACGRYVLVFNGEIYNHLELRKELQRHGQHFSWRGHSDTETLLSCFVNWGVERTLKSAVGMFAFALWDRQDRTLILARDRLGEKPLYWGWQGKTLVFGSELKALKAHPSFSASVDRGALSLLLRHNYIPAPYSIYKGIKKLLPGHFVSIPCGEEGRKAETHAYWDMNAVVESGLRTPFIGTDEDAVQTLEGILSKSISEQMLADVPLGAFLSGGVDSSLIVSLMQKQSERPIKTFTIGFREEGFNEAEHALAVAQHLHTEHTELYVGSAEAMAVIPKLADIYCEPFADSSQIPTFLVSQMARQHVTVALSGDAGDELFGGYNPYLFAPKVWRHLSRVPYALRKLAYRLGGQVNLPGKFQVLSEIVDSPTREVFYQKLLSHWKKTEGVVINGEVPDTFFDAAELWPATDSFESWMMAVDAQTYMVDDILVKVDRAAMANSLETRVPLLDHRVVEFAWKLPLDLKIRDGKGKWILRELLYRHVPKELIERPKKGFSIPLGAWLRGPLREWAESLLDPVVLAQQGYFHPQPIRQLWQQHLTGRVDRSRQLWSILMFQAWLQEQ